MSSQRLVEVAHDEHLMGADGPRVDLAVNITREHGVVACVGLAVEAARHVRRDDEHAMPLVDVDDDADDAARVRSHVGSAPRPEVVRNKQRDTVGVCSAGCDDDVVVGVR